MFISAFVIAVVSHIILIFCVILPRDTETINMFKIYAQVIIACILWGFSFVWTEVGLDSFRPVTLVLLRLVIATILLYIVARSMNKISNIKQGDWKYFMLLAAMEPYVYFMGETYAQTMVSPTLTSVVISTIPVFAPIPAFLFLKERLSLSNILGILLSLCGVLCIVLTNSAELAGNVIGIALLFLAVVSALVYGIVLRKLAFRYNSISIVFYQNLIGLLYFLPTFFITDFHRMGELPILPNAVFSVVMLAIFASVIAFIFFSNGVRVLGVARSNVFCNVMPVFTAFFAWIVVGEILTPTKVIGIIIVIIGLFVSQRHSKNTK